MSKQSLLLVDGDTRSLRVLEVSLRKAGFMVTAAMSVQDALDKLELHAPDLIISETTFPDGDGFELRRRVRATPEWSEIPFIFLTAEAAIENKIRGLELGVDDYLTKPIYIKEIVTRINILLQKRQRTRFEERRDGRTRFAGRVQDMPVVDVIQTIEISRKSGVIQFVGERGRQAAIYFRDGRVIDAEAGALQGEDAVYRLLTWSEGEFEVVFRTVRRREVIAMSSQGLLMEGMRRLDEWSRLFEQLPPLTHRFEVDTIELSARLGDVPDDNNRILRLVDGKRTLLEVIDASDVADLECLQAISRLYFEEMLIDLDHGNAPRRDTGSKPVALVELDGPAPVSDETSGPTSAAGDAPATVAAKAESGDDGAAPRAVAAAGSGPVEATKERISAARAAVVEDRPDRGRAEDLASAAADRGDRGRAEDLASAAADPGGHGRAEDLASVAADREDRGRGDDRIHARPGGRDGELGAAEGGRGDSAADADRTAAGDRAAAADRSAVGEGVADTGGAGGAAEGRGASGGNAAVRAGDAHDDDSHALDDADARAAADDAAHEAEAIEAADAKAADAGLDDNDGDGDDDSLELPTEAEPADRIAARNRLTDDDQTPVGPLMGGFRPSSLRLIDEAVAAAQAIEPTLFDDSRPDEPQPPSHEHHSNGVSKLTNGASHANGAGHDPGHDPSYDDDSALDRGISDEEAQKAMLVDASLREAGREDSGLRMIGSLGRDRAEASGELATFGHARPLRSETARELVTILPRRITRELPILTQELAESLPTPTPTASVLVARTVPPLDLSAPAGQSQRITLPGSGVTAPSASRRLLRVVRSVEGSGPGIVAMLLIVLAVVLAGTAALLRLRRHVPTAQVTPPFELNRDNQPAAGDRSPGTAIAPQVPAADPGDADRLAGAVGRAVTTDGGAGAAAGAARGAGADRAGGGAGVDRANGSAARRDAAAGHGDGGGRAETAVSRSDSVGTPTAASRGDGSADHHAAAPSRTDSTASRSDGAPGHVEIAAAAARPAADRNAEAKALCDQASNALDEGDFTKAFQLAASSVKLRHTARGYVLRARAEQRLGRVDDALSSLDAATEITPTSGAVWEQRGRILWAARRHDEARAAFSRFLELSPNSPSAAEVQRLLNEPR